MSKADTEGQKMNQEILSRQRRIVGTTAAFAAVSLAPLVIAGAQAQPQPDPNVKAIPLEKARPVSDPKALQMLRRMIQAERTRAYAGTEATFGPGRSTEETVKHDPKRGIRRESVRPAGEVFVDNFSRSWLLSTRSKTLTERPSLAKRMKEGDAVKRLLKQKLPVDIVGEEKVAGRMADIVSVNGSLPLGQASRRFWIDRKTGLRLRSEDRGPGGRILASAYYLSVDLNPTFGPDDFSRPVAPPEFQVVTEDRQTFRSYDQALQAGAPILRPAYLPAGFRLRTIEVTRKSGGKRAEQRITQRFDNGLSALTLVQSDRLPLPKRSLSAEDKKRDSGFFALPRGQRAYLWRDKATKVTFALLGSLPEDELKRIADSAK